MNRHLLYLFLLVLGACGKHEEKSQNVYFAGEIVNPTSKKVVLYKGDQIIDSAQLDIDNRFSFQLDSVTEGLYHFNHDPEVQYIYLRNGDSIVIRLNTVDFDESLIFTGKGEDINNFLLEQFLANEEEAKNISSYYWLGPEEFAHKIDSLKSDKMALLSDLKAEANLSPKEEKIATASIFYNYNTYKENYPFRHRHRTKNQIINDLPEDFYAYRNKLTFNDKDLTYLRPYYNFVKNHIGNLSFMTCSHKCVTENNVIKNNLHYNKHKLAVIDSLIEEEELRDNLFRNVAFDYLLKVRDSEKNNEEFIKGFHELSNNNRHIEEIETLYEGVRSIQPNRKIPNIYVSSVEGQSVSLAEISENKRTVFYFWSGVDRKHFNNITRRINKLSKEEPNYRFVGINIKTEEAQWKALMESAKLDPDNQFRATDFDELTKALIIYPLNKCIITKDDKIVDAFANVYHPL